MRITATLIDARSDQNVWSDTFDRTLTTENLFSIQDEIASAIAWQRVGFFDQAAADWQRCMDIEPKYLLCKMWMAHNLILLGRPEEGLAAFEQAVTEGGVGAGEWPFVFAYARKGDKKGLRFALSWMFHRHNVLNRNSSRLLRALTEDDFDFAAEGAIAEVEHRVVDDADIWSSPAFAYSYKRYDKMAVSESWDMLWWERFHEDFVTSPHRKRLIREAGVYDYWLHAGFPPQCRPLGDDFECD